MHYPLTPKVTVLGKVIIKPDKSFSFLSYLIHGPEHVLIDTVPERSGEAFLEELFELVPPEKLDALILNHAEEDHSGALGGLLARRPDLPIYCSPNCRARLAPRYPRADFRVVENGSSLRIGGLSFRFVHTPGLHWDDNMTTYLEQEHILFSNDLFGQSLGATVPLDNQFTKEALLAGARAYFEQVFSPATAEEKAVVFGLCPPELTRVAPGHGVVVSDHLDDLLAYYESVCQS